MLPQDALDRILQRFQYLEARLGEASAPEEIAALSREYAGLEPVVAQIDAWRAARAALDEAEALRDDPELRALAEEEAAAQRARLPALEQALRLEIGRAHV